MRETLMLAKLYEREKHRITGSYISEKLDGLRAWWDGGVSRGVHVSEIPWANHARSDQGAVATGLWSRYFKVIHCPAWWTDSLPEGVCLDGELVTHPVISVQRTNSIVRSRAADKGWNSIRYRVFDSMTLGDVLQPGRITNIKLTLDDYNYRPSERVFADRYGELLKLSLGDFASVHEHGQLSESYSEAQSELDTWLLTIVSAGGEGVMLRRPDSLWTPKRTDSLIKVKDFDEDTGIVVDVQPGVGRLVGLMGSLVVQWRGVIFNLGTGFSDQDRSLSWSVGEIVRFRYRTLSDGGVPKEARYVR